MTGNIVVAFFSPVAFLNLNLSIRTRTLPFDA